jgi:transcriptional regulator of aromatic amino acid metabolism
LPTRSLHNLLHNVGCTDPVLRVAVPPLRERLSDVPVLVEQFLEDLGQSMAVGRR